MRRYSFIHYSHEEVVRFFIPPQAGDIITFKGLSALMDRVLGQDGKHHFEGSSSSGYPLL
jgi:hypothetical protein